MGMQPITSPIKGTYGWFRRVMSDYMGWGSNLDVLDHQQSATLDEMLDSALHNFYSPPAIEMLLRPHEWSFLRPTLKLATTANQQAVDLPENFERFDGDLTYTADDDSFPSIKLISEQRIRQLTVSADATSQPQFAAIRPKASDGTTAQCQELMLWPVPDSDYVLSARYHALPGSLSESRPWPMGGALFAEVIKASCLREAELKKNKAPGPMNQVFLDRLASAVAADLRRAPDLIGYNGDNSIRSSILDRRNLVWSDITYNSGT